MSVCKEVARFVEARGELVDVFPGLFGMHKAYKVGNYLVLIDMTPFDESDSVVAVAKIQEGRMDFVYVSRGFVNGLKTLFGSVPEDVERLHDKMVLEDLLEEWGYGIL